VSSTFNLHSGGGEKPLKIQGKEYQKQSSLGPWANLKLTRGESEVNFYFVDPDELDAVARYATVLADKLRVEIAKEVEVKKTDAAMAQV
jgi:hypothetical protein